MSVFVTFCCCKGGPSKPTKKAKGGRANAVSEQKSDSNTGATSSGRATGPPQHVQEAGDSEDDAAATSSSRRRANEGSDSGQSDLEEELGFFRDYSQELGSSAGTEYKF